MPKNPIKKSAIDSSSSSIAPAIYKTAICSKCGSTKTKLGAGKLPGTASLLCAECDHLIKWLSKVETKAWAGGTK